MQMAAEKAEQEGMELEKPQENQEVKSKDEELLSSRFASLAKKEKALIEREKKYKESEERYKRFEDSINDIKNNPLAALESVGLTFEDLAQAYLRSQDPEYVPTPEEKIKSLEERINAKEEQEKKSKEEQERLALEKEQEYINESINSFKGQISEHIEAQGDRFELIIANDAKDMVYDVIESYYNEYNEVLDMDIAATQVEEYLEQEAKRILSLKKFAQKSVSEQKVEDKVFAVKENKPAPTLTNKSVSSIAPVSEKKTGLSREESLKHAASLIKWE